MITILYTDSDKVRSVLGVSDRELLDQTMLDLEIEDQLLLNLPEVYPDHVALAAIAEGPNAELTAEQDLAWRVLRQYVKYRAATYLLPQFQMITWKRLSDGDVDQTRYGPDDLAQFCDNIKGEADKYEEALNPSSDRLMVGFGLVTPGYDPVVNEGA